MLIGIDWGGTKIEIIALADDGTELLRERIATPKNDYEACVDAAVGLVQMCEARLGQSGSVGIGIPGTLSPATGLVKNANSTWLNGQNLKHDLEAKLQRDIRIQNDANCFTVSEAVDGVGAGKGLVCGIILGTGCGSGIAINGAPLLGAQGKRGCLETYISGTGFTRDYQMRTGGVGLQSVSEILALNSPESIACYQVYCDRLAQ